MPTNGYQVAFEHAVNEIGEINALLDKLTRRKDLLEKLVDLLKYVEPQTEASGNGSRLVNAGAFRALHEYADSEAGSSAKESANAEKEDSQGLSADQVAQLAHHFWTERGNGHGDHEQDWRRAEEELRTTR